MPASDRDRSLNILLVVALLLTAIGFSLPNHVEARVPKKTANTRVSPGIEEFLERNLNLVKGKNVGLLTHPAGVDRSLHSTLDLLAGRSGIHLAALYGPQHGVRITLSSVRSTACAATPRPANTSPLPLMRNTTCRFSASTARP